MKTRPLRAPAAWARPGLDPRIRNLTNALNLLSNKVMDHGLVATPDMSMGDVIAHCGTVVTGGDLNVFFSEGTWSFKEGYTINRPKVYFWGIPGATVFERHIDNTAPLLTLAGREVSISGIRFDDTAEDTEATVKITGSRAVVSGCVFEDCFQAIEANGGTGIRILDNYVISCRATTCAINITNNSTDGIVMANIIEQAGLSADICLDAGSARWAIVGNQTFNGSIRYTDTDGHSEAGSPGAAAEEFVETESEVVAREVFR